MDRFLVHARRAGWVVGQCYQFSSSFYSLARRLRCCPVHQFTDEVKRRIHMYLDGDYLRVSILLVGLSLW